MASLPPVTKACEHCSGEFRCYLKTHETVHHINGDRLDNRPENLELWSSRHGRGQRVADKLDFAKSILAEYGIASFTPSPEELILGAMSLGG